MWTNMHYDCKYGTGIIAIDSQTQTENQKTRYGHSPMCAGSAGWLLHSTHVTYGHNSCHMAWVASRRLYGITWMLYIYNYAEYACMYINQSYQTYAASTKHEFSYKVKRGQKLTVKKFGGGWGCITSNSVCTSESAKNKLRSVMCCTFSRVKKASFESAYFGTVCLPSSTWHHWPPPPCSLEW